VSWSHGSGSEKSPTKEHIGGLAKGPVLDQHVQNERVEHAGPPAHVIEKLVFKRFLLKSTSELKGGPL
jgi:hypothetical protein